MQVIGAFHGIEMTRVIKTNNTHTQTHTQELTQYNIHTHYNRIIKHTDKQSQGQTHKAHTNPNPIRQ